MGFPILRLNCHASRREDGQEGSIEALASENNYRDGAVERDQECDPLQGLFQKHLCSARAELLEPFISRNRRVSRRHLMPSPPARMSPYRDCERDPVTPSLGDPIHPRRLHGLCGGNIGAIIVLWPSQVAPSLIRRRADGA